MNRASLFCMGLSLAVASCVTNDTDETAGMDPALEHILRTKATWAWMKSSGRSQWSTTAIVYSSIPVYRIVEGNFSVKPEKSGTRGREHFDGNGSMNGREETAKKKMTMMQVRGRAVVERKRRYGLMDLGVIRLFSWNGKPEYIELPLDFTYESASVVPEDRKAFIRPSKH
jgi:hypothetical protein